MKRDSGRRRRAIAVLLAAIMVLSGISVIPAYGAAMNYTPSYVESPAYVLNDHTPFGVRFAAAAGSGLPEGTYYVKIRVANTDSRSTWDTSLHRGFTYDPVANHWEQERDDWFDCPTVTVAADGSIVNTWVYGKLGDETVTGTRYIHVALSATGDGTTYNPTVVPQVTVLDTKTQGAWVHNGTEDTTLDGKRAAIRHSDASAGDGDGSASTATIYSLWEAQENGVDDDSNGLVDAADPNEDYGLQTSNLGDYRLSAPLNTLLDIYVNRTKLRNDDFTVAAQADCDIAVPTDAAEGAADITAPPVTVSDLAAAVHGQSIDLTWTEGDDDDGGSGLASYRIYRWEVPTSADPVPYTPVPECIATVDAAATSFSDTTFTNDIEYAYQVRAEDVATNIGPRSSTVTVTAPAAPIVLSPVYRFYRASTGTHFYTADETEKATVLATLGNIFSYEGVGYSINAANPANSVPLYRFYRPSTGTHLYTADGGEKDTILATLGNLYSLDGVAYNVSLTSGTQVHRFYSPSKGVHFYSSDPTEIDYVKANLGHIWTYEGPAYLVAQ